MKQTLYITDLDGTLLTPEKKVSPRSVEIINRLLAEGMLFSVATARSAATAVELLAPLHLTAPGVLLNGALLYDFSKQEYIDCAPISHAAAKKVLEVLAEFNRPPFLYTLNQNEICVEFIRPANDFERAFFESRRGTFKVTLYNREFSGKTEESEQTDPMKKLLDFCKVPRSRMEITEWMGIETPAYVMKRYIRPLLKEGRLQMTLPQTPKSKKQRYVARE